jgi:hypothetical protein
MSDFLKSLANDPRLSKSLQRFMPQAAPAPAAAPSSAFDPAAELQRLNARVDALAAGGPAAGLVAQGWTQEAAAQIQQLAAQRGLDIASAAALFERQHPPPEPVMTGGPRYFPPPPQATIDLAPLYRGEDEVFLDRAIPAALSEVRGW